VFFSKEILTQGRKDDKAQGQGKPQIAQINSNSFDFPSRFSDFALENKFFR